MRASTYIFERPCPVIHDFQAPAEASLMKEKGRVGAIITPF
jgi:hypothetical protein